MRFDRQGASRGAASPADGLGGAPASADSRSNGTLEHMASAVCLGACVWIALVAGTTMVGWVLGDVSIVYFPSPQSFGLMTPLTAGSLLLCAAALFLLRKERESSGLRRRGAVILAAMAAMVGLLTLWEHLSGTYLGVDLILFPETLNAVGERSPGRPAFASSVSLVGGGLALVLLDARSRVLRRASEGLLLVIAFIATDRLISYAFSEARPYPDSWPMFGDSFFHPMAPKVATCFLALALGVLYARPARGLIGLLLARGSGGVLARWLLPAAVVLPIAFGWLGFMAMRAELQELEYPLSQVVSGMIVLLLLVISLNTRAIQRVEAERTRALIALAERERVQRAVFDNAGAGIVLIDAQARVLGSNSALQQMFGYAEDELTGMSVHRLTHPDDRESDRQFFRELLAGTRNAYRIEKRFIRRDGRHFWGQLNTSVARDDQGHAEFVIGMIDNITERREAEQAQKRLTAILDATPDFVGITDAMGRAVYVNRAGRQLTGVDDENVAGLAIPDFHPPDVARRVIKEVLPAAQETGVWSGETSLVGADGRHIPVSQVVLVHRLSTGEVAHYSTIMRDISDRKRMEEELRFLLDASHSLAGSLEVDAILRNLARLGVRGRSARCEIMLLTSDGRIERSAIARTATTGTGLLEQLRVYPACKTPDPLVADVARSREAAIVSELDETWLAQMGGDHRRMLARQRVPRSCMLVPMLGWDRVLGVICLAVMRPEQPYDDRDLALARELAARATLALDNARLFQQSRQATRVRDEVLRVVAHDLRNPLNTISLSAGLMREQLSPEQTEWSGTLDIIGRSVEQADHLIRDLLDVARMEAGQLNVEPEETDVHALAREAIELNSALAEQRAIRLEYQIPREPRLVPADRHRILQVFGNLIGNAIKFSPADSTVTLRADARNGAARFSVRDEGPGIEAAAVPHLFDPFWQASKHTGGAGLGLAISRGIVEAHGGHIWVDTEPGKGSTFYFTLPAAGHQQQAQSLAA